MNKKLFGILLAAVLAASLMASCSGGVKSTPATSSPSIQTTSSAGGTTSATTAAATSNTAIAPTASTTVSTARSTTPTTSVTAGESVEALLGRGQQNLANVRFDFVISDSGEEVSGSIWMKQGKIKMRMTMDGETMVIVMDESQQTSAVYFEESKTGFSTPYDKQQGTLVDDMDAVLEHKPQIVGYETIDGMPCTILEYSTVADGVTSVVRMWMWTQYGFPVKQESVTNGQTSTFLCKNIKFGVATDGDFAIPSDIEIMDLGSIGS